MDLQEKQGYLGDKEERRLDRAVRGILHYRLQESKKQIMIRIHIIRN
jgi:hypothetical protein